MKPRVYSLAFRNVATGERWRVWTVEFEEAGRADFCDFETFTSAVRFAYHIAKGGDRWQFVA